jgi:nanoRNase/pAp phosphatase (c-di-AMP/oligoRNAs hydrolase)
MTISETRLRLDALANLVKDEDRVLILMHDNPDPDAIASALGLQYLLDHLAKKPSLIAYAGIVARAENRAMLKHLGVKLSSMSKIALEDFPCIALVDTQPGTGNNSLPPDKLPRIVFDHHPFRTTSRKVPYREIKPKYNVTASIITEYLIASGLDLDPTLATALFYAIKSETEGLGREVGKIEAQLMHHLYPKVDQKLLANIENARVSREYFQIIHAALERALIYGDTVIANLESVASPDVVAELADVLMRLERIKWSFCFGAYNGDIVVSARTVDRGNDAGTLMQTAFGELGAAGGHEMMAAAKIPVKDKSARAKKVFVRQLISRLLDLTGNNSTKGERLIHRASMTHDN